jgi:pentatricopeptide repeat protein
MLAVFRLRRKLTSAASVISKTKTENIRTLGEERQNIALNRMLNSKNGHTIDRINILKSDLPEAVRVYIGMKSKNLTVSTAMVRKIAHAKESGAEVIEYVEDLNKTECPFWIRAYLKHLISKDIEAAFSYFKHAKVSRHLNISHFNTMIKGLFDCGYPDEAVSLYNSLASCNLLPDTQTFLILISRCLKLKMYNNCKAYFKHMEEFGIRDSKFQLLNLKYHVHNSSAPEIVQYFDCLEKKTIYHYAEMMKYYVKQRQYQEAKDLHDRMIQEGFKDNRWTILLLTTVATHFDGFSDRFEELYKMTFEMELKAFQESGLPFPFLNTFYRPIFVRYKDNPEFLMDILNDMNQLGLQPHRSLLSILIYSVCRHRGYDVSFRWISLVLNEKIKLSPDSFSMALRHLIYHRDIHSALKLVKVQKSHAVKPREKNIETIFKSITEQMNEDLLSQARSLLSDFHWNDQTFFLLFKYYRNDFDSARQLWGNYLCQCREKGIPLSNILREAMIQICLANGMRADIIEEC